MLSKIIQWSGRNPFLVLLATLFVVIAGVARVGEDAARCTARPVGRASHRLHRVPRPGAAGGRGPGDVPAHHRDARGTEVQGGARVLVLRCFVRLRDLRGRHRHLLGAQPGAGVPELRLQPPAQRRDTFARARRHGCRLGLPVRAAGEEQDARRTAHDPGLVRALPTDQGARASPKWHRSAASCRPTRSPSIRSSCAATASR